MQTSPLAKAARQSAYRGTRSLLVLALPPAPACTRVTQAGGFKAARPSPSWSDLLRLGSGGSFLASKTVPAECPGCVHLARSACPRC